MKRFALIVLTTVFAQSCNADNLCRELPSAAADVYRGDILPILKAALPTVAGFDIASGRISNSITALKEQAEACISARANGAVIAQKVLIVFGELKTSLSFFEVDTDAQARRQLEFAQSIAVSNISTLMELHLPVRERTYDHVEEPPSGNDVNYEFCRRLPVAALTEYQREILPLFQKSLPTLSGFRSTTKEVNDRVVGLQEKALACRKLSRVGEKDGQTTGTIIDVSEKVYMLVQELRALSSVVRVKSEMEAKRELDFMASRAKKTIKDLTELSHAAE